MLRIAVAVVALLAAALAGCGSQEAAPATTVEDAPAERDTATVEAGDGSAVLSIPAGALPEGVTLEDIEIREVSDDPDLFVATEGDPPLAVFRLEPDGLQFSEPVTLTVQLQVEDPSGQLFAVHVFGDEAELITDVESEVDPESNMLTASMQLTHFSAVWVTYVANVFEVEVSASASEVPVGGTFEVSVVVTRTAEAGQLIETLTVPAGEFYHSMTDDPWQLEGSMSGAGPIAPKEVEDIPSLTSVSGPTFIVPPEEFECASAGPAHTVYAAAIHYQLRAVVVVQDYGGLESEPSARTANIKGFSNQVQCVMPKIVASAAPPLTTYTLSPEIPSATSFGWSGADCGSVTGSTTSTMVWSHGEEGCEHAGEAHPGAQISVLVSGTFPVSGESYELRCTYRSAASGEGVECSIPR